MPRLYYLSLLSKSLVLKPKSKPVNHGYHVNYAKVFSTASGLRFIPSQKELSHNDEKKIDNGENSNGGKKINNDKKITRDKKNPSTAITITQQQQKKKYYSFYDHPYCDVKMPSEAPAVGMDLLFLFLFLFGLIIAADRNGYFDKGKVGDDKGEKERKAEEEEKKKKKGKREEKKVDEKKGKNEGEGEGSEKKGDKMDWIADWTTR